MNTITDRNFVPYPHYRKNDPAGQHATGVVSAGFAVPIIRSNPTSLSTVAAVSGVTPILSTADRQVGSTSAHQGVGTRAWTVAMVETTVRSRAISGDSHLLALFDVLHDLINRPDRNARMFIEILAGVSNTEGESVVLQSKMGALVSTFADEMGVGNAVVLTASWNILIRGTIDQAIGGDFDAAHHAKDMARTLLTQHRIPLLTAHPVAAPYDDNTFDYILDIDDFSVNA